MSSNRTSNVPGRPFKPTLTSARTTGGSPLTPRVAAAATASAPSLSSRRTPVSTPRIRQSESDAKEDGIGSNNVTPRSAKRRSRVEQGNGTPLNLDDTPDSTRPKTVAGLQNTHIQSGLGIGRGSLSRSPYSEPGVPRVHSPFVRSPIASEVGAGDRDDVDNRFFHASDIDKVDPAPVKKPEPKKPAAFFYADGQQEAQQSALRTRSPARSDRIPSQTSRVDTISPANTMRSQQPLLSPALSTVSSSSPFFAHVNPQKTRSPSPSKENIHLSYRKGVSQIFGSRPSPIPNQRTSEERSERRPSLQRTQFSHQKSTSMSSIDTNISQEPRRRSNTAHDTTPLRAEASVVEEAVEDSPRMPPPLDTAVSPVPTESGLMSPTKSISDLAADARRERKVLDLEISNSSLLAINASLEREIRRQKIELKRFRRLSRAGRFSFAPSDATRESGLDDLAEDAELESLALFGPASGLSERYDDSSEDEGSSVLSGETDEYGFRPDRLAKDERRLRADLDKHKELLVQGQMMNQSIRRCMYATDDMIKDGKRALEYKVRVSDIKLGGRILSAGADEDEDGEPVEQIEVEDDFESNLASPMSAAEDPASSFVEIWGNVGKIDKVKERISLEGSEGGDRDSGIEVDKAYSLLHGRAEGGAEGGAEGAQVAAQTQ